MSGFKTDTVKLKVFSNDTAASGSTPENDGGELAVVGTNATDAVLKRYDGLNNTWVAVGSSYSAGHGTSITTSNEIDLDVANLTSVVGAIKENSIPIAQGNATASTRLENISISNFKDMDQLAEPLTNSENNKLIQVKQYATNQASKLTITLANITQSSGNQTILFQSDIDGPGSGTSKYFQIDISLGASSSIGFSGAAPADGSNSNPYTAICQATSASHGINIVNVLDNLESIFKNSPNNGTYQRASAQITGFTGWTTGWTVSKDYNARTIVVESITPNAAYDFAGVSVTSTTNNTVSATTNINFSSGNNSYRYEHASPDLEHLGNVTGTPSNGQVLTYNGSAWAPAAAGSGSGTEDNHLHYTSFTSNFPVSSNAWSASFTLLSTYNSGWSTLASSARQKINHATFSNFHSAGSNKLILHPADDFHSEGVKVEILNHSTANLIVDRNDTNDPQFVEITAGGSPSNTDVNSITIPSNQRAIFIKESDSHFGGNPKKWTVCFATI